MKKVNYIAVINGRKFRARYDDVYQVHDLDAISDWGMPVRLSDVYGRYSYSKEAAWNDWCDWIGNHYEAGMCMHIISHTAQFFTLGMVVKDQATGEWWYCTATGRNEYATKIQIVE